MVHNFPFLPRDRGPVILEPGPLYVGTVFSSMAIPNTPVIRKAEL
jgi:hypothetical protein